MSRFGSILLVLLLAGAARAQDLPAAVADPYVAYTNSMEARDYRAALTAAEQAWSAAARLEIDPMTKAILADNYAQLADGLGEYAQARDAYRAAAELLTESGAEPDLLSETWALAAGAALNAQDFREALRCADTAGDLAENADGMPPRTRAVLTFTSRAIQANAHWFEGHIRNAGVRAAEAMEAAETFDLTDHARFGLTAFILGATHAMKKEYPDAAYRLTQAYHHLPEQRRPLAIWAQHARNNLDDDEREALLTRLEREGLVDDQASIEDDEDNADTPPHAQPQSEEEVERVDAAPVRRGAPSYPAAALRAGYEGVAVVQFAVDEQGRTSDIEVIFSLPFREFGEEVVEAVRGWRYTPATENGSPRRQEGLVTQIEFLLEE